MTFYAPEDRVDFYYQEIKSEGIGFFHHVTKQKCAEAIQFLDRNYPRWEQDAGAAIYDYLFAALAQLFPQCATVKYGRTFKFPNPPARKIPVPRPRTPTISTRSVPAPEMKSSKCGIFWTIIVLGILILGYVLRVRLNALF